MSNDALQKSSLPAYLKGREKDHTGTEHLTKDDLQMPRLTLIQPTSKQLVPNDAKYIKGAVLGELVNDLTGENYGTGPIEFAIVRADPPRWIQFEPIEDGGKVIDPNVPAGDPRTEFGPDGEKPQATKFYDYVVMLIPSGEVIALSMKGSSLKSAKRMNSLMRFHRGPLWTGRYSVTSRIKSNTMGTFAVYDVRKLGYVDEDTAILTEQLFHEIADKPLDIPREPDTDTPLDDAF